VPWRGARGRCLIGLYHIEMEMENVNENGGNDICLVPYRFANVAKAG
jgi:hypothetical protein